MRQLPRYWWAVTGLGAVISLASFFGMDGVAFAGRWIAVLGTCLLGFHRRTLTTWILISMIVGVEIGHDWPEVGTSLRLFSQIFLKMIKTIIAPLLFATLVVGIAGHSDLKQVGRLGLKSIIYFEVVTTIALFIGIAAINVTKAGVGVTPPPAEEALPQTAKQTFSDAVLHAFPENIAKSVAEGQVLQIVVFSLLFGVSLALYEGEHKQSLLGIINALAETMFRFTKIVMYFAPIGVGAAMAYTVGHMGLAILKNLLMLLLTLYGALLVFMLFVLVPVALWARIDIPRFAKTIAEPVSIAFATTSSESALPLAMQRMEQFGVPRQVVAFVMPTGYSFNLDGSTLYLALATVFVAQASGQDLPIATQLLIVLTLMLTSKGVAGVPRATLVILLGTAASFNLPVWPIMAILGIDELMDMARTSVNVIGNCLATAVMARWEGVLQDPPKEPTTAA